MRTDQPERTIERLFNQERRGQLARCSRNENEKEESPQTEPARDLASPIQRVTKQDSHDLSSLCKVRLASFLDAGGNHRNQKLTAFFQYLQLSLA